MPSCRGQGLLLQPHRGPGQRLVWAVIAHVWVLLVLLLWPQEQQRKGRKGKESRHHRCQGRFVRRRRARSRERRRARCGHWVRRRRTLQQVHLSKARVMSLMCRLLGVLQAVWVVLVS